jgi:hypothetical protein
MENVDEFQSWIDKMLTDAKTKLHISDETITYILLQKGTSYYLKTLSKCGECKIK